MSDAANGMNATNGTNDNPGNVQSGAIVLTDEVRAKRVAVARDVKARIELGKLNMDTGSYIDLDDVDDEVREFPGDLQDKVDEVEAGCTVCALGALLLSKARVFDAVPMSLIDDCPGQSTFHEALSDVFDPTTLYLIESAFETGDFASDDATDEARALARGAAMFGYGFSGDDERCVAVMDRIIEGNGEFVVEPATLSEYLAMDDDDDIDDLDDEDEFIDDDDDDDDDFDDDDDADDLDDEESDD